LSCFIIQITSHQVPFTFFSLSFFCIFVFFFVFLIKLFKLPTKPINRVFDFFGWHYFFILKKIFQSYGWVWLTNLVNKKLKREGVLLFPSSQNTILWNNVSLIFFLIYLSTLSLLRIKLHDCFQITFYKVILVSLQGPQV